MKRRTLEDMCDALYEDPAVCAAVIAEVRRIDTEEQVLSGELVLPHPIDAGNWHDAKTGRAGYTAKEKAMDVRIRTLEQLVFELTKAATDKLPPEREAVLKERITELQQEGGA